MSAPISREKIVFDFKFSGTSPCTMRCASPSAIAVLPTPGSPTNIGLFLVRRDKICITLRISSSLPMTGSILPLRAISFRLRAYFFKALYFPSGFWSVTRCPPRISSITLRKFVSVMPNSFKSLPVLSCALTRAMSRCSMLTNSSCILPAT